MSKVTSMKILEQLVLELKAQISDMKSDMKSELSDMKSELKADLDKMKTGLEKGQNEIVEEMRELRVKSQELRRKLYIWKSQLNV